jgi:hypothetical protein
MQLSGGDGLGITASDVIDEIGYQPMEQKDKVLALLCGVIASIVVPVCIYECLYICVCTGAWTHVYTCQDVWYWCVCMCVTASAVIDEIGYQPMEQKDKFLAVLCGVVASVVVPVCMCVCLTQAYSEHSQTCSSHS